MKKYNKMKRVLMILLLGVLACGCVKDNFWYSGVSKGKFDGSLLEYLESNSYDWDSTALMVHHAGEATVRLFEGKDPDYPEITFFGPTNHSIRRYMLEKGIKQIADMDPDWCAEVLRRHIVKGKIYRDEVPAGKPGMNGAAVGEGGQNYKALAGNRIHLFTYRADYNGVVGLGAVTLYISSLDSSMGVKDFDWLASTNIEPDNCVVHSLGYNFTLGEM